MMMIAIQVGSLGGWEEKETELLLWSPDEFPTRRNSEKLHISRCGFMETLHLVQPTDPRKPEQVVSCPVGSGASDLKSFR